MKPKGSTVGLLMVAAGLLLVSCAAEGGGQAAGSGSPPTETVTPPEQTSPATGGPAEGRAAASMQTISVRVTGGQVQTASERVEVALGTPVRIEVTADTADEVHVHGYDRSAPVSPAQPAVLEFVADIPGEFEVELEQAGLQLLALRVQ